MPTFTCRKAAKFFSQELEKLQSLFPTGSDAGKLLELREEKQCHEKSAFVLDLIIHLETPSATPVNGYEAKENTSLFFDWLHAPFWQL